MWTEAHRARHEAALKSMVSFHTVGQVAQWLERADPPRSGRATPYAAVVRALAWQLRVGGSWRSLPAGLVPWRTAYGWFRRWQEQGLFDALLRHVAVLRRHRGLALPCHEGGHRDLYGCGFFGRHALILGHTAGALSHHHGAMQNRLERRGGEPGHHRRERVGGGLGGSVHTEPLFGVAGYEIQRTT